MDIIAQTEELKQNITLQRSQALKNWESGDVEIDTPIPDISEDKTD